MKVIGHLKQRELLSKMLQANSLPSSILFSGVSGVGKKLIATRLARTLFCEMANSKSLLTLQENCDCTSCKVFDAGNLPDFHLVECADRQEANTDSIRRLLSSLHLKSFGGKSKVVVMNDIEQLSAQALNALLKILEEPKDNLYFILVTPSRSKLLPTILSRCLCLHFERLSDAEILSLLPAQAKLAERDTSKLPPSVSLKELASLADGSFENVEQLVENLGEWQEVQRKLVRLSRGDLAHGLEWANELASSKDSLSQKLSLIRIAARRLMLSAAKGEASHTKPEHWAYLLQSLLDAQTAIFDRNLSALYVLQYIFSEFTHSLDVPHNSRFPLPLSEVCA